MCYPMKESRVRRKSYSFNNRTGNDFFVQVVYLSDPWSTKKNSRENGVRVHSVSRADRHKSWLDLETSGLPATAVEMMYRRVGVLLTDKDIIGTTKCVQCWPTQHVVIDHFIRPVLRPIIFQPCVHFRRVCPVIEKLVLNSPAAWNVFRYARRYVE